ncbi:MAG: hypothetical protein V3U31_01425 [Dehalococcoidia bacterium]
MPLITGGIALLLVAVGGVLFRGAEALSLGLLTVLVEADEGLAFPEDEGENPGLPALKLIQNTEGLGLPARVGMGWIVWLVDRLEGRRPRVRRLLWGLVLGSAGLFVRLGSAMDMALRRGAPERVRRRLGRRLLYEIVVAHRTS